MPKPYLHFSREEFADRQARVRAALSERGLDGLLLSRIEDQYWICGLDTEGMVIFHAMFIGVGGQLTHVTRTADLASIDFSSICDDDYTPDTVAADCPVIRAGPMSTVTEPSSWVVTARTPARVATPNSPGFTRPESTR